MPKTDISVRELVDKINRNELRLPEMQRRYVWSATRVRDLLDSLYRAYPSGTILTWETDENIVSRDMQVEAKNIPATTQKLLLLDGQQRLTSLAAVLGGKPIKVKNRVRPIDIMFNLEHPEGPPSEALEINDNLLEELEGEKSAEKDLQEEIKKRTFVVAFRALANDPLWVSVSDIFIKSESEILKKVGINSDDSLWDKYSDRIQKVKKIQDYQYVMQTLEKDKSYEEVTEIFVRVNSLGIKLRGSDLALAQITSKWRGFMNKLEEFTKEFDENNDYILDSGLPVRLMVINATHQSKFKTVGRLSKKRLEENWEKAKEGLLYSYNFIKSNAKIDRLDILSSPFLMLPIAVYYIENNEKVSPEEEKKLLRWLYYAHMRGHYSMGSSESILDADLNILYKKKNLNDLISKLRQHVKKFKVDIEDLAYKTQRNPMFSMLYTIFKIKGAKDWLTGLSLSDRHLGTSHKIQFHHIFPKSLLSDKSYENNEINEISNFAFIGGKTNRKITNKKPIDYLESQIIVKGGKDALTSQLVTLDKDLWSLDKYRDFLSIRRQAIAEEINNFMKKFE